MDYAIAGVGVALLIVGIVEAAKEFGLGGKWPRLLALILGAFFVGLAHGIQEALLPAAWVPYIEWAVTALAGSLAAMGYYDLGKRFMGRSNCCEE